MRGGWSPGTAAGATSAPKPRRGDTARHVDASPLLALRVGGQDHALEGGRDYLLGSAPECDLRLAGAAPQHARLGLVAGGVHVVDLGSVGGTFCNGERLVAATLTAGDVLRLGDAEVAIVPDTGRAAIVPIPALREGARQRRLAATRQAAAALRDDGGQSFDELLAAELRRAPWLLASLLLHALLLLLLWLLLPAPPAGDRPRGRTALDWRDVPDAAADPAMAPPVAVDETADEPLAAEPVPFARDEPAAPPDAAPAPGREPPVDGLRQRLFPSRAAGNGGADLGGVGSATFQRAVGELRQSGLEIVFVFDSTGSMTRTIRDAKATISRMLAVLRALVPDARIGLVTYRDRGPREEYLVRSVPLDTDFHRAANFVQFVTADGGGDLPEDVRAGLREAFAQPWSRGSRRVVVLAGDAPPHAADRDRLLAEVRAFASNGRSFVHALLTAPSAAADVDAEALAAFQDIAAAGRGICQRLANGDLVLQRVLTLAFGREFDRDVASAVQAVDAATQRVDVRSLDLVRRGGPELAAALRQRPVPQELWNALVRRARRGTCLALIDLLGDAATPPHSRQAIAAALQTILALPTPPIDPVRAETSARDLVWLRSLADRVPE
jgi:hypothetical protein